MSVRRAALPHNASEAQSRRMAALERRVGVVERNPFIRRTSDIAIHGANLLDGDLIANVGESSISTGPPGHSVSVNGEGVEGTGIIHNVNVPDGPAFINNNVNGQSAALNHQVYSSGEGASISHEASAEGAQGDAVIQHTALASAETGQASIEHESQAPTSHVLMNAESLDGNLAASVKASQTPSDGDSDMLSEPASYSTDFPQAIPSRLTLQTDDGPEDFASAESGNGLILDGSDYSFYDADYVGEDVSSFTMALDLEINHLYTSGLSVALYLYASAPGEGDVGIINVGGEYFEGLTYGAGFDSSSMTFGQSISGPGTPDDIGEDFPSASTIDSEGMSLHLEMTLNADGTGTSAYSINGGTLNTYSFSGATYYYGGLSTLIPGFNGNAVPMDEGGDDQDSTSDTSVVLKNWSWSATYGSDTSGPMVVLTALGPAATTKLTVDTGQVTIDGDLVVTGSVTSTGSGGDSLSEPDALRAPAVAPKMGTESFEGNGTSQVRFDIEAPIANSSPTHFVASPRGAWTGEVHAGGRIDDGEHLSLQATSSEGSFTNGQRYHFSYVASV
jgi:hypothetical protein